MIAFLAQAVSDFASFGAAGIMGAMWYFERRQSRKRDEQLDEAHKRIMSDGVKLDELVKVVRQSAEVNASLLESHRQLLAFLNDRLDGGVQH